MRNRIVSYCNAVMDGSTDRYHDIHGRPLGLDRCPICNSRQLSVIDNYDKEIVFACCNSCLQFYYNPVGEGL